MKQNKGILPALKIHLKTAVPHFFTLKYFRRNKDLSTELLRILAAQKAAKLPGVKV